MYTMAALVILVVSYGTLVAKQQCSPFISRSLTIGVADTSQLYHGQGDNVGLSSGSRLKSCDSRN